VPRSESTYADAVAKSKGKAAEMQSIKPPPAAWASDEACDHARRYVPIITAMGP
jgi:hypothetical protein